MVDFNGSMTRLIEEIVANVPEFHFIDVRRMILSATFNRSKRGSGLLAYVLPLKFRDGSPVERRVRGTKVYHWGMLPVFHEGVEILYVIYFMLPRFYNMSLREKLETIIHELYHINPSLNGDLRWFKGRSRLHGVMEEYEEKVRQMTDDFLDTSHDPETYRFLKLSYSQAETIYGEVVATHFPEPRPRLIKVVAEKETVAG